MTIWLGTTDLGLHFISHPSNYVKTENQISSSYIQESTKNASQTLLIQVSPPEFEILNSLILFPK